MRPIPVPKVLREADWVYGTRVYSGPSGDLVDDPIPPAEGVLYRADFGEQGGLRSMVGVVLYLEDEDMERIRAGSRHLLLSWPGERMPVFTIPVVLDPLE